MLNYTLGQEPFLNGVRKYLKANLLSNVDENDLWETLNEFAHQEANLPSEFHLKDIMYNWTRKAGYPIVQVTRDYENNTAVVTQVSRSIAFNSLQFRGAGFHPLIFFYRKDFSDLKEITNSGTIHTTTRKKTPNGGFL